MANLLEKASIVLTPTAYNNGEALCIKPDDGSGDFDFSRATEATRVNSQGLIETVGNNLPRINYEGGCGSWLFEPQSTNLVTYSEDFSDSSWSKSKTIVEAATITLPDGLTSGYKLYANTNQASHWMEVLPFPTATSGQDFTLSLFVKSAGSDFIQVATSTGFPSKYQNFNISTGTKASGNVSSSSIFDFGNGWYRITVTETTTGTNARYLIVPALSDITRNAAFQGNANEDGVYIWGAQLEQQSYATSYIPTSGTSVTKNQDRCTNGGSLASINSTEGTLYFEGSVLENTNSFEVISLSDATNSNAVAFVYRNIANQFTAVVKSGGSTSLSRTITLADATSTIKAAISYKLNDFKFYVNGVLILADTSGNTPIGLNSLQFTDANGTSNKFFGKTKALAVWKEALSDSELQELTTI